MRQCLTLPALLISLFLTSSSLAQVKTHIAILPENQPLRTRLSTYSAARLTNFAIEKGIARGLSEIAANDGAIFDIADHSQIKALGDAVFATSEAVDPDEAARIARLRGIDFLVFIGVTQTKTGMIPESTHPFAGLRITLQILSCDSGILIRLPSFFMDQTPYASAEKGDSPEHKMLGEAVSEGMKRLQNYLSGSNEKNVAGGGNATADNEMPTIAAKQRSFVAGPGHVLYKQDKFGEAKPLLDRECSAGNMRSCSDLGSMFEKGKGVVEDAEQARGFYLKACKGGDLSGCDGLGVLYHYGQGVVADDIRARTLFLGACSGGYANSCNNLGIMYRDSLGVHQDYETARKAFEQSCLHEDGDGCGSLGYLYDHGLGGNQDHLKARKLYRQACDGDVLFACNNLGNMYYKGESVPEDDGQAAMLFRKACEGGFSMGCDNLKKLR